MSTATTDELMTELTPMLQAFAAHEQGEHFVIIGRRGEGRTGLIIQCTTGMLMEALVVIVNTLGEERFRSLCEDAVVHSRDCDGHATIDADGGTVLFRPPGSDAVH